MRGLFLLALVVLIVLPENFSSVITRRSAEEMQLKTGDPVTAVVKATEVTLSKP